MTKRFTTNTYYIYDHFTENKWLCNEVEAEEIVKKMNNLDTKARERSKALSKLQKENGQLKQQVDEMISIFENSGLDYHISDELNEILNR